jgi:hypothetical protein
MRHERLGGAHLNCIGVHATRGSAPRLPSIAQEHRRVSGPLLPTRTRLACEEGYRMDRDLVTAARRGDQAAFMDLAPSSSAAAGRYCLPRPPRRRHRSSHRPRRPPLYRQAPCFRPGTARTNPAWSWDPACRQPLDRVLLARLHIQWIPTGREVARPRRRTRRWTSGNCRSGRYFSTAPAASS